MECSTAGKSGGKLCARLMVLKASKQIWPAEAASAGVAGRMVMGMRDCGVTRRV